MTSTTALTDNTMTRLMHQLRAIIPLHRIWEGQQETELVRVMRDIKNSTIGNRSRKIRFLAAGIIPSLANVLNGAKNDQLLLQTAAVVGSLFNVPAQVIDPQTMVVPLEHLEQILIALVRRISHGNIKVVERVVCSLKVMYGCVPSLGSHGHSIVEDREITAMLVKFLEPPSTVTHGNAAASNTLSASSATLIAHACGTRAHQDMVASYGGIQRLSQMLFSTHPKAQEAALEALSSLCNKNGEISLQLVTEERIISQIIALLKSKKARTRLLAVNCIANINISTSSEVLREHLKSNEIKGTVLPTVLKLLNTYVSRPADSSLQTGNLKTSGTTSSSGASPSTSSSFSTNVASISMRSSLESEEDLIREEAPRVLAKLIENSHELQQAACESDTVSRLSALLLSDGISDASREYILRALAALCSHTEEARKLLVDLKALRPIAEALTSQRIGLREAACLCSRGLSRAKRQTRAFMLDNGFTEPLIRCLAESQRSVPLPCSTNMQATACAAVGNLVLDFLPVKILVIEYSGCMDAVMAMTRSLNRELRINSLALLKNLVNKAQDMIKGTALQKITGDYLLHLLRDSDGKVQELAFSILRNLSCGSLQAMERFFQRHGRELIHETATVLSNSQSNTQSNIQTLIQAIYFLSNASVASTTMRELVMERSITDQIIALIHHQNPEVRVGVLFAIGNLTWKDDDAQMENRVRYFREAGVESQVRRLLEREVLVDVRMRSKQVLEQIQDRSQNGNNRGVISAPAGHDPVAT